MKAFHFALCMALTAASSACAELPAQSKSGSATAVENAAALAPWHAIAEHGDITDIAFMEKALGVHFTISPKWIPEQKDALGTTGLLGFYLITTDPLKHNKISEYQIYQAGDVTYYIVKNQIFVADLRVYFTDKDVCIRASDLKSWSNQPI